jgi:hypothetical protein
LLLNGAINLENYFDFYQQMALIVAKHNLNKYGILFVDVQEICHDFFVLREFHTNFVG